MPLFEHRWFWSAVVVCVLNHPCSYLARTKQYLVITGCLFGVFVTFWRNCLSSCVSGCSSAYFETTVSELEQLGVRNDTNNTETN